MRLRPKEQEQAYQYDKKPELLSPDELTHLKAGLRQLNYHQPFKGIHVKLEAPNTPYVDIVMTGKNGSVLYLRDVPLKPQYLDGYQNSQVISFFRKGYGEGYNSMEPLVTGLVTITCISALLAACVCLKSDEDVPGWVVPVAVALGGSMIYLMPELIIGAISPPLSKRQRKKLDNIALIHGGLWNKDAYLFFEKRLSEKKLGLDIDVCLEELLEEE